MDRALPIFVDRKTWPKSGIPNFPPSFINGNGAFDLNIPSMLLMIGYLTTPTTTTGVSLSEFWAWVRYLAAIAPTTDGDNVLRITESFATLDAHQKTILSDDFGMGVPMLWLTNTLDLDLIVDGRYFMQQYATTLNTTQRRAAKRGPNKTPDFVARDINGLWHVIECKGTQSGTEYRDRQLIGGVSQKQSIKFPVGHVGQRLVCGLSIGIEGDDGSQLKVVDPVPDEPIKISKKQLPQATDTATRGVMSKLLRMSGYEVAAETMASPSGQLSMFGKDISRNPKEDLRELLDKRDAQARVELSEKPRNKGKRHKLFDNQFIGRETRLELPRSIMIDGKSVSSVIVKHGVNLEAVRSLAEKPTIETTLEGDWLNLVGKNKTKSDGSSASLDIGQLFHAEIHLER